MHAFGISLTAFVDVVNIVCAAINIGMLVFWVRQLRDMNARNADQEGRVRLIVHAGDPIPEMLAKTANSANPTK